MLAFDNITTLASQQQARFFQAGFNYSVAKNIQIQGLVLDLANSFGVTGVWSGIHTISHGTPDYQPLLINGVNFGSGRIETITFDQGNDVQKKTYSATIAVLESGNLFNFTGTYYSGVNLVAPQYLDQFTESNDFQHKENGGYSSTRNASIRFTSGVGQLNAIQSAQTLARTLFTGSNLGLAFYSGYTSKLGKRFFTESYNLIDNSCDFQESFEFDVDDGNYSAVHTNSVSLGEDGVVLAQEQGLIRGIANPNYQSALSALATELTGSYYRCSGISTYYFPSGALLFNAPTVQGRNLNIFENSLSYNVSFNNNPNNSGTYFWDYTTQMSRSQGIGTFVENGTVLGRGGNPINAFVAAQGGFAIVKPGIPYRSTTLFLSSFGTGTNFLESKKEGYGPHAGRVTYDYQYSNDPALIANSGIRKKETSVQSNQSIYAFTKLDLFNNKEIVQDQKQSTVGSTTIDVVMEGDKTVGLSNFLGLALTEVLARAPVGNDRYVGDASYSYDPNNNNANVKLTWVYNQAATKTLYP